MAENQIDLVSLENSIAERSKRFRTFDDRREHSRYMALALAGEVGELCNLVKKEWRGDPRGLDGKALLDEASDIFVYWTLFCHVHGWTIQRVMEHADQKAERKILSLEAERAAAPAATERGEREGSWRMTDTNRCGNTVNLAAVAPDGARGSVCEPPPQRLSSNPLPPPPIETDPR